MWEESQEMAFRTLKQRLLSQPILQYPDFSREFILTTDASNDGAGALLSQGQIGKDLPLHTQAAASIKLKEITVQWKRNYKRLHWH